MINIEVEKKGSESAPNLLRRFSKRMRGSGVLQRVKRIRYHSRPKSKFVQKKSALKMLKRKNERDKLIKLGKISEMPLQKRFRK
jgi:ribosomal protein S21